MSDRWPGGIIRKTPVVPTGPFETGTASGVWTMDQAAYWKKQNLWPTQGVIQSDPYFTYVSMLLGTTSLNGAQNNTFLDSSTNNFTITRVGNTTQGSFGPYGSNWSYYFDGYFTNPNSGVMTGDFTVEFWMYLENYSVARGIYTAGNETPQRVGFYITTGGRLAWDLYGAGTTTIGTDGSVPLRTWAHVALVKSGSTCTGYINGTAVGSGSMGYTFGNANGISILGGWLGYASNFRVVNGTAIYTSNFTPPTAPLTAVSGTYVLTAQSNRIVDNGPNNLTLTRVNTVSVTDFGPFAPAAQYNPATSVGSAYLDGSGDNLTAASNAAFGFGSGDFTVEFWFYNAAGSVINDDRYISFGATSGCLNITSNGGIGVVNEAVVHLIQNTGVNFDVGAWNHLAFTRSGSTLRLFKNGVQFASATSSAGNSTGSFLLNTCGLAAYVSNLRIVKGTAVYTSNFTPPTSPLTAISGTSLLLNGSNAGIYDAATINDMETVGNAQVSTMQAKFGTTSVALDGNGDYLLTPSNPAYGLASTNFTIEAWVYVTSSSEAYQHVVKGVGSGGNNLMYIDYTGGSNGVLSSNAGGAPASQSGVTLNTWHHVAVVRNGSSVTCYVNGVGGTPQTLNPGASGSVALFVGYDGGTSPARYFNGYIDDLRITKGIARYTTNFTPPTAAFPTF